MPVPSALATASLAAQRAASESSPALARGDLVRREHAAQEALAVALQHQSDAGDLDEVGACN